MSDLNGTDINIHEDTICELTRELCNMFVHWLESARRAENAQKLLATAVICV
jgi:hypothetical protein